MNPQPNPTHTAPPGQPPQAIDWDEAMPGRVPVQNTWALLSKKERQTALFQYDQVKLRYQYAIRREYQPRPSWWKRKSIKEAVERMFEDVDEEIYYDERFEKAVKGQESQRLKELSRIQKSQENLEEVLAGYDQFTVDEEKKIAELTRSAIQRLVTVERQTGII
jgi:hypothetical protein